MSTAKLKYKIITIISKSTLVYSSHTLFLQCIIMNLISGSKNIAYLPGLKRFHMIDKINENFENTNTYSYKRSFAAHTIAFITCIKTKKLL